MSIKSIPINNIIHRSLLIFVSVFIVVCCFFVLKWALANAAASQSIYKEVSELTIFLSPDDPQTHYSLGALSEKSLMTEDFPKAVENYEKAVSVSPNDFRLWLVLGRSRERNGDAQGAEKALRKALELAPNYAEVHWVLGNILLRTGEIERAFSEIRQAAEKDSKYANPAVQTAWNTFDGNFDLIVDKLGDSDSVKSFLALFLAKQNKFEDAFTTWQKISPDERKTIFKQNTQELLSLFLTAKKYRSAVFLQNEIEEDENLKPMLNKVTNGDFEFIVKPQNAPVFDWQISDGSQPLIGIDNVQKHEGNQSLTMTFNVTSGQNFRQMLQFIAVEKNKKYQLEFFARSELQKTSNLKWEISDADTGKVLASSGMPKTNGNWEKFVLDFSTVEETQAIILRFPINCGNNCEIIGRVWFDSFKLNLVS